MPAMAFLNASALEPEFQAMTLIVTGPESAGLAGAAAAGALVGWPAAAGAAGLLSAGFGASAGLAGSAGFAGAAGADEEDWPHAARTTAPAPSASEPRRRRRLRYIPNLAFFADDA